MSRQERIHQYLTLAATEICEFIKEEQPHSSTGWVAAAEIKRRLELDYPAGPKINGTSGQRGWLFGTLVRMLEDNNLVEFKKEANGRAFYKAT